jgi:transcriptional regulator with XRE-family HTH domain
MDSQAAVSLPQIAIQHREPYGAATMLTGAQIRAARSLLGLTTQQLADASGIHYATISRAEQVDGVPSIRATTLATIQAALERAGVLFLSAGDTRDGGPGVRLRAVP